MCSVGTALLASRTKRIPRRHKYIQIPIITTTISLHPLASSWTDVSSNTRI